MGHRRYDVEELGQGPIFEEGQRLYIAAMGHESERREDLRKTLKVSRRHFDRHLKEKPNVLNKTRMALFEHKLKREAEDRGVENLIIPLQNCTIRVLSGSAAVLDSSSTPGWEQAQVILVPYGNEVIDTVNEFAHPLGDGQRRAIAVVGSVFVWTEVVYLRNRNRKGYLPPMHLADARPYAPINVGNRTVSSLDRFFCQRAGINDAMTAAPEMVWTDLALSPGNHDDPKDGFERKLRRWRTGRVGEHGGRPPSNFICQSDCRHPCNESDRTVRQAFESVLAVQMLWRHLREQGISDHVAGEYLGRLLAISDE